MMKTHSFLSYLVCAATLGTALLAFADNDEYIITVGADGGSSTISMKTATTLNSSTYVTRNFVYSDSGVFSREWITDVQVYGLVTGVSGTVDPNGIPAYNSWRSLIKRDGTRMTGINFVVYERYGNALQLKASCSANTTGAERSFRGKLNNRGDYLTVKQLATSKYTFTTSTGGADIPASGGTFTVYAKNNTSIAYSIYNYYCMYGTNVVTVSASGNSWTAGGTIAYTMTIPTNTTSSRRGFTLSLPILLGNTQQGTENVGFWQAAAGSSSSVPTAPTSISATTTLTTGIKVTWSGGSGATSYNVWRGTSTTRSAASKVKTGATSPWTDTSSALVAGIQYYYWIEAVNSAGSSFSSYDWGKMVEETSPAPSNDSFSSPLTVSGSSGSKTGSNVGATMQSSESKPPAQTNSTGSVWFSWTAPSSGTATFDTSGSDYNTVLGVYTGTSISSLTCIASNDDSDGTRQSKLTFSAVSGTTYRIAIYGYNGATGNYKLNWSLESTPSTYTVTYKPGSNGTGSQQTATKTNGVALTLKDAIFTRTGYTQTGWATSDGGACVYDLSASYTSNSALTLYPYWTASTYAIFYDYGGGTKGASNPSSGTYDAAFYVSAPSKSGCAFNGWSVTNGLNFSTAKWGTSSSPSLSISSSSSVCANGTAGNVWFLNLRSTSGSVTLRANWTVSLPTALDNSSLNFTTGGAADWFGQTSTTHDGVDAARSGLVGHSEATWLETTVSGPGILSFWWKVSSEASWDVLKVAVDGTVDSSISGSDGGWERKSLSIASGAHTVRWTYSKDFSQTNGSDCAWVDQVSFAADTSSRVGTPAVSASGTQAGVELVWGEVTNATEFAVWRAESANGTRTQLSSRVTTNTVGMYATVDGQFTYVESRSYSATDATGTPGQDYWYWVVASNATSSATSSAATSWRRVGLSVSPGTLVVPSVGGTGTVAVTANTRWSAIGGDGWLAFTEVGFNGNGICAFRADANTETADRVAAVIIEAGAGTAHPATETVTVTQEGFRFAIGDFAMDMENGLVWLRFSGTKGTAYRVERVRNFGGTWATALSFTATNDGVNEVNASIPGKWDTGFFRLATDATNATVAPEVPANTTTGLYLVVDLSGGPDAANYPTSYLDAEPQGGWGDEFKTTKLVLRRINPGTYTMGCETTEIGYTGYEAVPHEVTITQPFYLGVFEVTQKQWELVMGTKPSYFSNASYYEKRPVEEVSWNTIRGTSSTYNWPSSSEVAATSFLGKLRAKAVGGPGLSWDLPTEAQWEYACRAGTTTAFNNGTNLGSTSSSDTTMNTLGRFWYNFPSGNTSYSSSSTTDAGTAEVGSYLPNAWGLYDMHGNVWEWTLDWYQSRSGFTSDPATDPKGPTSGSYRVLRGGSWCNNNFAQYCRSANRGNDYPSYENYGNGFRLACVPGL